MRYRIASFDDIAHDPDAALHVGVTQSPPDTFAFAGRSVCDSRDDVVEIRDAIVHARGGILWKDYWVEGSEIHYYAHEWATQTWRPGDVDMTGRFVEIDLPDSDATPAPGLPLLHCDTAVARVNFAHFVFDFLPYGRIFRALTGRFPDLAALVHPMRYPSQNVLMPLVFGVEPDRFFASNDHIRVPHLLVPRRQTVMHGPNWRLSRPALLAARDAIMAAFGIDAAGSTADGAHPCRVILHRGRDAATDAARTRIGERDYDNVAVLLHALFRLGFALVDPALVPVAKVARVLARADTVIGIHGANMANILFCRPGAHVIELRPAIGAWGCFEAVAAALGLRFQSHATPPRADDRAPSIDVDAVIAIVRDVLS